MSHHPINVVVDDFGDGLKWGSIMVISMFRHRCIQMSQSALLPLVAAQVDGKRFLSWTPDRRGSVVGPCRDTGPGGIRRWNIGNLSRRAGPVLSFWIVGIHIMTIRLDGVYMRTLACGSRG